MTYEELESLLLMIWGYILRAFAIVGFFAVIAIASYIYHSNGVTTKVARSARCINSDCNEPCKPKARFVRHAGECVQ